ncbi:MAG: integrase core domain-containing protein, partial [candidate division WOR-3 bacterium]
AEYFLFLNYQYTNGNFVKVFPDLDLFPNSYNLNQENGFLFVGLVTMWLRYWGIDKEVFYKEDWGKEFGGDDPHKLRLINERRYKIYGAVLGKAPKGRKGYQGRVERSHKTDDEEFYIPLIPTFKNCSHFLKETQKWQIYYNTKRPHFWLLY